MPHHPHERWLSDSREHLRSQIDLEDPRFMTDEDKLLSRIVS